MNFDRMRALVLEQAIQGKLVPQLESEPNVCQISEESDCAPFAIPEKWKWTKLGKIGRWRAGGTPSRSHPEYYQNGHIPWLKTGDLTDGIIESVGECITEEAVANSSTHINPIGSVLIAMYGATIGKLGILRFPCATNQACCACDVNMQICNRWYLFYYLLSQREAFIAQGAGGAQPNISRTKIVNYRIPLPPLEEQVRIVAKIKQLFEQIDLAEKAYNELSGPLSNRFRQLCLEQAIQGKLVPQLESEPEVAQIGGLPTTIPFAIPKKWKWVQLRAIGKIVGGGTPKTNISDYWDNGCIPWFTPSDLGKVNGIYIEESGRKITTLGLANSSASMMPERAVLFSSRAPIGHIALSKVKCCTNQGCKSFVANESYISPMWAYWVLRARTQDIIARASGTTFKEISGRGMADTWIPLPPVEEQHRIVTQLLKIFDVIKF